MPRQNSPTLAEEIQAAEKIQAAEFDRKENRKMKITINLDNQGYKNKPKGATIGAIVNRTKNKEAIVTIEAEELINKIRAGYTFTPAVMTGHTEPELQCWKSQQVIVADIDNEKPNKKAIDHQLPPAAALEACRAAGIDPFCIYKTFNYSEAKQKYRVVIILEAPLTDAAEAERVNKLFTNYFNKAAADIYREAGEEPEPCADSSINITKLIFGSREDSIYYYSGNVTSLEKLQSLPEYTPPTKKNPTPKKDRQPSRYTDDTNNHDVIVEALSYIDPAQLSYKEWFTIAAALKTAGIEYSIFDQWSAKDASINEDGQPRYNEEANYKTWEKIDDANTAGNAGAGTIIYYAKQYGFTPPRRNVPLDWNDGLEADYPEPTADDIPPEIFEDADHQETAGGDPIQEQTTGGGNSASDNGSQEQASQQKKGPIWYNAAKSIRPDNHNAPYDREIKELQKYANRKTGFDNIDRYLTLYPGLAALGGQASLGKTTFAVNLALSLLRQGEHVLYFALEQRAEELLTKVIAQYLYRTGNTDTTNLQLAAGKTSDAIDGARTNLAEQIEHFNIIECDFETTAATIEAIVTEYQNKKGVNPIVIVDYLQLIAEPFGFRGGDKERIDYNLKALKKMQKQHKLFVLVVSSFNRSSNLEPISYESFFGTSMIEYTCDYVFGLQLAIQDADNEAFYVKTGSQGGKYRQEDYEKKKMLHEAQQQTPKQVQFVSIKNRRGKQYFTANFDYYPAHDYFMETEGSNYTNGYSNTIDGTIKKGEAKISLEEAYKNPLDKDDE